MARHLQWDWTPARQEAVQLCPIGATGHASWICGSDGKWSQKQPDMSGCKSVAFSNLEKQVRNEDPENLLVSKLSYLTRTKSLFGGDLESVVATMRTVINQIIK